MEKDNPVRVSIITPSLNQGEFLEEAIVSVLQQEYPDIEYIIIDGGSTDSTRDILQKYSSRIARIISEPDSGQSNAINKGFRLATGDIVAWLNADDCYFPGAVRTAVNAFRKINDLDLFYGNAVFVNEHSEFLRYFVEVQPFNGEILLDYSDYIMQPTTFIRRKTLENLNYIREDLHYGMDWDLWCRMTRSDCRFHFEEKLIAANRVYSATKTLSGGAKRSRELMRINREHKTGLIPWGGLSYWAGEMLRNTSSIWCGLLARMVFRMVRQGKGMLRKELRRFMHGVEGHGSRLQQEFTLSTPWFRPPPQHLEIEFFFHGEGGAIVQLQCGNDKAEQFISPYFPCTMYLPLTEPLPTPQIDVHGWWQPHNSLRGNLVLKNVRVQ